MLDRRHNALAEVDMKLRDALALYDTAMASAMPQLAAGPPTAPYPTMTQSHSAGNMQYQQPMGQQHPMMMNQQQQ